MKKPNGTGATYKVNVPNILRHFLLLLPREIPVLRTCFAVLIDSARERGLGRIRIVQSPPGLVSLRSPGALLPSAPNRKDISKHQEDYLDKIHRCLKRRMNLSIIEVRYRSSRCNLEVVRRSLEGELGRYRYHAIDLYNSNL